MTENHAESATQLAEAWAAYDALDLERALAIFQAASTNAPDHYETCLGLARTYTRMRREEPAYAAARRCVELDPARYEGYATLAMLDFLTDKLDSALEALGQAIQRAPSEIEPRLTRSQVYADLKRYSEANAELEAARLLIEDLADETQRRQMTAFLMHAETYTLLAEGSISGASERAEAILEYEEDNPYAVSLAYANLGLMYARSRRWDDAIRYLERAYTMNPHFYRVAGVLGRVFLVRGQNARAAEVLGEVVATMPTPDAHTIHAYAAALERSRQREAALEQYRLAAHSGLKGLELVLARWKMVWLHPTGRFVVIAAGMAAVLAWLLLARPTPQSITFLALLAVILFLQRTFSRRR